jgi:hypothetical protein
MQKSKFINYINLFLSADSQLEDQAYITYKLDSPCYISRMNSFAHQIRRNSRSASF